MCSLLEYSFCDEYFKITFVTSVYILLKCILLILHIIQVFMYVYKDYIYIYTKQSTLFMQFWAYEERTPDRKLQMWVLFKPYGTISEK